MKNNLLFVFVFGSIAFNSIAQQTDMLLKLPMKDSLIVYEEIVNLDDTSLIKNKIYIGAKSWFVNKFIDANSVLQLDDKIEGVIMGKGRMTVVAAILNSPPTYADFTIKIDIRDFRYRVSVFDITFISPPSRIESSYKATATELYHAYLTRLMPPHLKYTLEGKKGFFKRVGNDLRIVDIEVKDFFPSLKKSINSKAGKSEDW